MHIMLLWYAETASSAEAMASRAARFNRAVREIAPDSWSRIDKGGGDWGVTILHPADLGPYRWPVIATDGPVTAVSLGIPVGLDVTGGAIALARRLLVGEDVHRDVVPPFGLLALDTDRFALQQDWLGMARVFTGTADGVTAYCTRPGLLAAFLRGMVEPDLSGWASYATSGHFGGEHSPLAGIRLLRAGERTTGRRQSGGTWHVASEQRYSIDDVVALGRADQGRPVQEQLDRAASALTQTANSLSRLCADPITLGLSGGKDSRLLAATMIAADRMPRFLTYEDNAAEGATARELIRLLREKRRLDPDHTLELAAAPEEVLGTGLRERTQLLQHQYDYQFPSSYLVRPASGPRLPEVVRPATYTGAGGELATAYWYPPTEADPMPAPRATAMKRLMAAAPLKSVMPEVVAAEQARLGAILDHAEAAGVQGLYLIDYLYLAERVRRWYTSAYATGMVTPFLAPGFVTAAFAITPEQKRERLLHTRLIAQLVPEWADVPFANVAARKSKATRIWEGDGVQVMSDLLDTSQGPLTEMMHRPTVELALRTAALGGEPEAPILQQFTALAVATEQLMPDAVRPSSGETYARVARPRPPAKPGERAWNLLRKARRTVLARLSRRS
jgi:hypothetical protein